MYNNEEKSIINTSDKNINIHENSISDEYNLKYINKCGMHLIVYFKITNNKIINEIFKYL